MKTRTNILTFVYFFIGALFIVLQYQPSFYQALITKALIMPVLMVMLIVSLPPFTNTLHRLMLCGLIFSFMGDVILELSHHNESLFVPGLVSFLLAHIMYLAVFLRTPGTNTILKSKAYIFLPVLIYGAGLVFFLYNDLGNMRLPVILYAVVILSMLASAINRFGKVNQLSFYMVLAGAILFVISDSSIAVNKFSLPFRYSDVEIMVTYIAAQYLIILGYIYQHRE